MTAREIIDQYDYFLNTHGENVDRHVLSAMQEYARIQIEKDRESSIDDPEIRHCIDMLRKKPIALD